MSSLAKAALVGVGAFAAERMSAGAAASSPVDESAAGVLAELGHGPVCAAELAGAAAESFAGAWSRDATALRSEYGTLVGELPALRAACCVEWAKRWLDALQALHDSGVEGAGIRYNFGGLEGVPGSVQNVYQRPTALWSKFVIGRGGLGSAWLNLLDAYLYVKGWVEEVPNDDLPYLHCREIAEATRTLARELDISATVELTTFGQEISGAAKAAARSLGNGIAWGVEELLAPVVGAVGAATVGAFTSAAAPYLVVGGVVYLAWRHR